MFFVAELVKNCNIFSHSFTLSFHVDEKLFFYNKYQNINAILKQEIFTYTKYKKKYKYETF